MRPWRRPRTIQTATADLAGFDYGADTQQPAEAHGHVYDLPRNTTDHLATRDVYALAVCYLRVSIKERAERGGRDEGFSIPAQREANLRKSRELNAIITEEFVDAGESARKADRPELMRMIEYVETHNVAYCIVHKVDRLARNRADDVAMHLAL